MRSVNKVILMGNLAADPVVRQTKGGISVANFPLATNNDWLDGNGEKQQTTDFHKIVVWRGLAETSGKFLEKGSGVYVEGRLANRVYEGKDQSKRKITEVIADKILFVALKKARNGPSEINLEEKKEGEKELVAA